MPAVFTDTAVRLRTVSTGKAPENLTDFAYDVPRHTQDASEAGSRSS